MQAAASNLPVFNVDDLNAMMAQAHITPIQAPPQALPLIAQAVNETAWVKSFDLIYGTKNPALNPHKEVVIDGDKIHEILRGRENQERECRDHNGSVPNFVVASISFVLSDRSHVKGGAHGRKVIELPIKYSGQDISHVTKVYTFDDKAVTITPQASGPPKTKTYKRSTEFKADLLEDSPQDRQSRVATYYAKGTNTFSDSYHHSERALWGALKKPEMIQSLVDDILARIRHTPAIGLYKIYAAVLDLHSTRYMCSECEPSSFCFQKKRGKFLNRLEEALNKRFFLSRTKGLTFCTRVSAEDNSKRVLKQVFQHADFWRDRQIKHLRCGTPNLILQRDDRTTNPGANKYGVFVSSERLNAVQAVFLTKNRANPSVALELTGSNKAFIQNLAENKNAVAGILAQITQHRLANRDKAERLAMIETAYNLCPNDINVLVANYSVLIENGRLIEAINPCRKVYRFVVTQHTVHNSSSREWAGYLNTHATTVLTLLTEGETNILEQVGQIDCLYTLDDFDVPHLFMVRGLYHKEIKQVVEAREDFEKALRLLQQDPFSAENRADWIDYCTLCLDDLPQAANVAMK